jgi:hypothetical protein
MDTNIPLNTIMAILPYIIPLLVIQLGLAVFCLVDLLRRERTRGPKWMWAIIIVFGEILGPVIYLLVGKQE